MKPNTPIVIKQGSCFICTARLILSSYALKDDTVHALVINHTEPPLSPITIWEFPLVHNSIFVS